MMTPVNRVYNAHILYDPQHGYYWLDEHLNEEQYLQLIYLISVAGEISHRSPSAYVITKLISSAYRRLIDND